MQSPRLESTSPRARLMVPESAAVLKRFLFLQRELILMQAGWVPGTVNWECKLLLPEMLWQDSTIFRLLRERVLELRYPERRIVADADAPLLADWGALRNAPDGLAFTAGSLPALKRHLRRAFCAYLDLADSLNDGPTVRILRQAVADIDQQLAAIDAAVGKSGATPDAAWGAAATRALAAQDPMQLLAAEPEAARFAFDWRAAGGREFALARRGARDPRFPRVLFCWPDRLDSTRGPGEGMELQVRAAVHHLNEIWATEMAAAVLCDFADEAPHDFIEDAARWCYDESRHCRMGYTRFLEWGFAPSEMPVDSWSYDASAESDPLVRLGTIYYFETTYIHTKSARTKIFTRDGDRLSAHDMDFDWADELIHTHYGDKWLKHFVASRRDPRPAEDLKNEAHRLVRQIQDSATERDRADTDRIYRATLARAEALVGAEPAAR